jgi:NADP-dependent 3-hydroxy acid dehydrogenase YdfG
MAASLRAEYPDAGLRVFNLEPGTVVTEVMRMLGVDGAITARYKPCTAAAIAAVVAWLADNDPRPAWEPDTVLNAPAIARELKLLDSPSLLDS